MRQMAFHWPDRNEDRMFAITRRMYWLAASTYRVSLNFCSGLEVSLVAAYVSTPSSWSIPSFTLMSDTRLSWDWCCHFFWDKAAGIYPWLQHHICTAQARQNAQQALPCMLLYLTDTADWQLLLTNQVWRRMLLLSWKMIDESFYDKNHIYRWDLDLLGWVIGVLTC